MYRLKIMECVCSDETARASETNQTNQKNQARTHSRRPTQAESTGNEGRWGRHLAPTGTISLSINQARSRSIPNQSLVVTTQTDDREQLPGIMPSPTTMPSKKRSRWARPPEKFLHAQWQKGTGLDRSNQTTRQEVRRQIMKT